MHFEVFLLNMNKIVLVFVCRDYQSLWIEYTSIDVKFTNYSGDYKLSRLYGRRSRLRRVRKKFPSSRIKECHHDWMLPLFKAFYYRTSEWEFEIVWMEKLCFRKFNSMNLIVKYLLNYSIYYENLFMFAKRKQTTRT